MATFVQIGDFWLNVDRVRSIHLTESRKSPGEYTTARVFFAEGDSQDFRDKDQVAALQTFLQSRKAE